jgi:hypothetical protein
MQLLNRFCSLIVARDRAGPYRWFTDRKAVAS